MTKEASSNSAAGIADVRRSLGRIAIEIVIGFVGVYAAFALTAYHEKRELDDRRRQVTKALIAEITPLVELSRRNIDGYKITLAAFDSLLKAGRKPTPIAFTEPIGLNMHVWEATKQSGGLNLMDVPTFVKVGEFYNSISTMLAIYAQLRELSVNVILPNAAHAPDGLYDARTGELRADVRRLYYWDLRALSNSSARAAKEGSDVIRLLQRSQ